jgi:hypothetical protein
MKVLVGCEFSGVVRRAFAAKDGVEAYSNDLLPAEDGGEHIQGDVIAAIVSRQWDLIILHPPCQYLSVSGNGHHAYGKPTFHKRKEAAQWTANLWSIARARCPRVALENPVGVLQRYAGMIPTQYIQPHWFGHPESKKTALYLSGLKPLVPTRILELPESGRWSNQTPTGQNNLGPEADRWKERSRTYNGIAQAMAETWSICN